VLVEHDVSIDTVYSIGKKTALQVAEEEGERVVVTVLKEQYIARGLTVSVYEVKEDQRIRFFRRRRRRGSLDRFDKAGRYIPESSSDDASSSLSLEEEVSDEDDSDSDEEEFSSDDDEHDDEDDVSSSKNSEDSMEDFL
jgi:hypothetical protein